MKICLKGSASAQSMFNLCLDGNAEFVPYSDAELCIVEVNSVDILFKAPKKFSMNTYFYVTSKDPQIMDNIKDFNIAGIFFPPLKKEDVLKKLIASSKHNSGTARSGDNFDVIKAKIIAKAENIPALPELARDVLKLTRQENSQLKDFVEKIKKDQGLSSKIIKLVNSPFYGLRKDVNSIDRATVFLGVNTIKNLALAVSTEGYYNKQFNLYHTSGQQMWIHSFNVACLAENIGKLCSQDSEALYLAGLMHDLGKTVLVDFLVKEVESPEDETEALGLDHPAVSEFILNKWSVSKEITEAVKNHHEITDDMFSNVLYFANKIEKHIENMEEIIKEAAEILNIDINKLNDTIKKTISSGDTDE